MAELVEEASVAEKDKDLDAQANLEGIAEELGLESWHVLDWGNDEYARGCWSIPLVGYSPVHTKVLATPLSPRFSLAGEHCSPRNSASVHGAAETGIKAGRATADWSEPEGSEHVVIVGGGAAGISAAVELRKKRPNARITIVEARQRLLGRINTIILGKGGGDGHQSVSFDDNALVKEEEDDVRVDMGASWLHSCDNNNHLYGYCRENNIPLHDSDFDNCLGAAKDGKPCHGSHMMAGLLMCESRKTLRKVHRKRHGSVGSELERDTSNISLWEEPECDGTEIDTVTRDRALSYVYDEAVENMPVDVDIDMNLNDALRPWLTDCSPEERRMSALALRGVIGVDSGELFSKLSAHWLFEQPGPGYGDKFLGRGFASVFEGEIAGLKPIFKKGSDVFEPPPPGDVHVWLSTPVSKIDWSEEGGSHVSIETTRGVLNADRCICTIPIEPLKQGSIEMIPPLPRGYQRAMATLGMSFVGKIALRFSKRWWPTQSGEDRNMLHWYGGACDFEDKCTLTGFTADDVPTVPWVEWLDTTDALGQPVLVGFTAGKEARRMRGDGPVPKSDRQVALEACLLLKTWAMVVNAMEASGHSARVPQK
jgi:monoamine oxidase